MKRAGQIITFVVGFMGGLALGSYYYFLPDWRWLLAAIIITLSLLRLKSKLGYLIFISLGFLAGSAYMSWHISALPSHTISDYQFYKTTVSGEVYGDPYWDADRNYVFYLRDLKVDGRKIPGEMRVKSLIGNAKEGYRVQVTGKVWPILGKTGNQISYAKPILINTHHPVLVRIKSSFVGGVRRALPEPAASFMVGILIGARSNLPKYLQDNLNSIGLSHIVAVSGYNLTILTIALARVLGKRWRWGNLVLSLWVILGFVLLTGASPSILRAGIMAALFMTASYWGRDLVLEVCLALGALVTLIINPTYLLGDLSWQLSFLSLTGIVFLAPKIESWLPHRGKLAILSEILAVTLAAQIVTLPLVAYTFGRVSLIAPLANLIIMPLIPLLMLLGFASGLAGVMLPNFAFTLMSPIARATELIIASLNTMAGYKWSAITVEQVSAAKVAITYGLIIVLALLRRPKGFKRSLKSGIIQAETPAGEVSSKPALSRS